MTGLRQLLVLGGIGASVVGGLALRGGDEPAATAAARAAGAEATPGQGAPGGAEGAVADVRLELLTVNRDGPEGSERNLFRFRPRPQAPSAVTAARPVAPGPPPPQGPPPLPPIPLKFIGLLNAPTQAGRVAMLSDGRGNVFQAREGDIIEGRYRLTKIGAESAELAYADGRGRQVIRLSGQ